MKKVLLSLCVTFLCTAFFSQNAKVRVIVTSAKCINVDEETKSYLPSIVQQKFEANIGQYMHFLIVDTSNLNEVKKLQQNSEGDSYDEATAIKIGKLANANYAFFPRITKAGKKYILSVGCTDLTTGLQSANAMSKSFQEVDKLFDGSGSAADEVTLKLCEQLGLVLTDNQVNVLASGSGDTSNDAFEANKQRQKASLHQKEREDFIKEMRKNCDTIYEKASDFEYFTSSETGKIVISGLKEKDITHDYGVIIPDEIDGVKVTEVIGNCFYYNSIRIYNALPKRKQTKKRENELYKELRDDMKTYNLFNHCVKYVLFNDNIKILQRSDLRGCTNLEKVMLPNEITTIESELFCLCDKLKSITIPESVTKIGYSAFRGCRNLSNESKDEIKKRGYKDSF